MRRTLTTLAVALAVVLALAGLASGATPNAKQQRQPNARALAAAAAPSFEAPSFDNGGTLTYNHFGSASKGQVVLETTLLTTYDPEDFLPDSTTGQARAILVKGATPAKRVAFRVTVFTDQGDELSSATVNTNGAGQLSVSAPKITNLRGDNPICAVFQEVTFTIRWSDDTLTSGKTFQTPSQWWNDNCYFLDEEEPTD